VLIARPVTTVFDFFTNPRNDLRWRTHVREIDTRGKREVGTRIRQVVAGPGGRGIPADLEITAYDPPSHYAFAVVAGPARPVGDFRFRATADGGTEVTFTLRAQLTGVRRLLARPVRRSMDGELANLDRAKSLLEAS
jgi:uncharacterized protein YndB with AHSA1/START domain